MPREQPDVAMSHVVNARVVDVITRGRLRNVGARARAPRRFITEIELFAAILTRGFPNARKLSSAHEWSGARAVARGAALTRNFPWSRESAYAPRRIRMRRN